MLSAVQRIAPRLPVRVPVRALAVGLPLEIRRKTLVSAHSTPKARRTIKDFPPTLSGTSEVHIFPSPFNPSTESIKHD